MLVRMQSKTPQTRARAVLENLFCELEKEFKREVKVLQKLIGNPTELEGLQAVLLRLVQVREAVSQSLKTSPVGAPASFPLLRKLSCEMTEALQEQPWSHYEARLGLTCIIRRLVIAESQLAACGLGYTSKIRRIIVPSDLLWLAHQSLFPAERMLVVAGRSSSQETVLGSAFDVTGASTTGHVRADDELLRRALIAMEVSGTHLAAWLHSHPGSGPEGTRPSSIDRRQHREWIRDYSPRLLSGIFVRDGYVRFWGTAFEGGQINVQISGSGVRKEKADGIYRLHKEG